MRHARGISRSEAKRLAVLAKALDPGIAPLRKLLADGWRPEPLSRLLQELRLDPEKQIGCQILAASLAIYLIVERRGGPPWDRIRQAELLAEVHRRRQKSTTVLLDEQVCRLIAKDKKSPPYFRRSPRTAQPKGQGLVKQLRYAQREFQANSLARAKFPLAFD
jgi:hypothetical protein